VFFPYSEKSVLTLIQNTQNYGSLHFNLHIFKRKWKHKKFWTEQKQEFPEFKVLSMSL
jgi:hypothetical protein